ncbi:MULTISPECIES: type IV secretion system protein [unclassified Luteimonas]|uniref:type IV secretion system protein n=1 Tax=unclassified Luteimonas TaxID=2629088 RepID=UPI0018F09055|nr:type IV secretion system protein [Luteimonas sp. MC1750]MBJ6979639.1 type IV secretion system protein [Luteimonas sp. MC1895]MBJ6983076.1 type IV secretion system protein [Luteimonas sp. MC1750]QQO05211.1 type IV secretion system protein [Luteimonas sp. MC1750]
MSIDSLVGLAATGMDWAQVQGLPNMVFFQEINGFLDDEIGEFAGNLLGRVVTVAGSAALTLLTLWILVQGYRIATGLSREPMMALVGDALKAVLVIGIATGAAAGGGSTYRILTDGLGDVVTQVVTGDEDGGAYDDIDRALAIMQVALQVIDAIDHGGDLITEQRKSRAMWLAGVGLGGPAIIAASMLLLNKVAIALVVGLGPIFILCLLFRATRQLFSKWLYYGLGTLFSLALLTVMVTLAMDMLIAVGVAFWVADWLTGAPQESLSSMALQQGGLGLILTMLIVSAPPMAAMFFNGVLGQFSPYNAVGVATGSQAPPPGSGLPPGVAGRAG